MAKKPATVEKVIWAWEGKDKQGKRVIGEFAALTEIQVKAELRRLAITPIRIRKKRKPLLGGGKAIVPKDIAIFARQLSTMMTAGLPIVQALDIMSQSSEKKAMQELVTKVKGDVEGGMTLANALDQHRVYFDELFVNLVRAGEEAGALEAVLDRVATYKEKTESLKAKIKKAMTYPIAVLVVAFVVTAILLIFVIPQFKEVFSSFGADLPAFTLFVIGLSEAFQAYWWAIFGTIGGLIFTFVAVKRRSDAFNHFLDRLILRVPIFGPLMEKSAIARFARTLSTMFSAGVPLVEAMPPTAGATGNIVFRDAILKMRDMAASGSPLRLSMQQSGLFPVMVVQMVGIGEETGELDKMLSKVADMFEEEVDNMVDALSSLMEPMIMAFLGIVVGGLVVAMYLPIFKLGAAI